MDIKCAIGFKNVTEVMKYKEAIYDVIEIIIHPNYFPGEHDQVLIMNYILFQCFKIFHDIKSILDPNPIVVLG